MVSVEDAGLRGGGNRLKQEIWNAARETISEWTQQELTECSLYGIRVYKEGAILSTHVDRLPLVSSAIINVASDVDEPWPLEVYGHDGKATNVTMVRIVVVFGGDIWGEVLFVLQKRSFMIHDSFGVNGFCFFSHRNLVTWCCTSHIPFFMVRLVQRTKGNVEIVVTSVKGWSTHNHAFGVSFFPFRPSFSAQGTICCQHFYSF